MKVIGAHGQKIRHRTNVRRPVRRRNAMTPRRARLSAATMVKRYGDRAIEVAAATRELSHTTKQREHWNKVIAQLETMRGARKNPGRRAIGRGAKGRRANPLPIRVAFKEGPPVALFRSLPRARQYAQALADHSGRQVRVQG